MCRQLQYCRNRTNTCADICSRNRTNSKRSIAAPPHWSLWRILGCLHTSSQNSIAFSFIWAERCTRQRWGKLRAFRGRCWFKGERCPGQRLAPIVFCIWKNKLTQRCPDRAEQFKNANVFAELFVFVHKGLNYKKSPTTNDQDLHQTNIVWQCAFEGMSICMVSLFRMLRPWQEW